MNDIFQVLEEKKIYISKFDYELYQNIVFIGKIEDCLLIEEFLEENNINNEYNYYIVSEFYKLS